MLRVFLRVAAAVGAVFLCVAGTGYVWIFHPHAIYALRRPFTWKPDPATITIAPSDTIELKEIGGFRTGYWIRLYGDGKIQRNTTLPIIATNGSVLTMSGCPLEYKDREIRVSSAAAAAIFERFIRDGFYQLDPSYDPPANVSTHDGGRSRMTVKIGSHRASVQVSDVYGLPPIYNDLKQAVYNISPMDNLTDSSKFSPQRTAECSSYDQTMQRWEEAGRKGPIPDL